MNKILVAVVIILVIVVSYIILYSDNNSAAKIDSRKEDAANLSNAGEQSREEKYGLACNVSIQSVRGGPVSVDSTLVYSYPGARAFLHGGDPPCEHVYESAFVHNNSKVCGYLDNEKARAICTGSAISSATDYSFCDSIKQPSKDFCLLNVVLKFYELHLTNNETDYMKFCNQVNNSLLKSNCLSFAVADLNDSQMCSFQGNEQVLCLSKYIERNLPAVESLIGEENGARTKEAVQICNSFFSHHEDLLNCYYSAGTYNVWLYGNRTTFGTRFQDDTIMEFFDFFHLSGKPIIQLTLSHQYTANNVSGYTSESFLCNSVFSNVSEVSGKCVKLPSSQELPHWKYK